MPLPALIFAFLTVAAAAGLLLLILWGIRIVRKRRVTTLLSYLDQAVRLNLPLPRMLSAATTSERGTLALRLMHVRALVEEGAPLGAALEAAVPEMPHRESSIIAASERIGRLGGGIDHCLRQRAQALRRSSMDEQVFYRAYPLVMVVMLSFVIGMVMVFVLPKFEQIFQDFGVELPWITRTIFGIAREIGPALLFAIVAAALIICAMWLFQVVNPARSRGMLPRRARDRMFWVLPLLHAVERDRGLADAFDLLAEAFTIGTPADRALAEAASLGVNEVLRQRLHRWTLAVSSGASLGDGARAASLPPLVVGMLSNVSATAAAADVFAFLARYYRTRFSRTAALLEGAIVPLVTFFFAFLVLAVALAMFMPLIALIQTLTDQALKWRM